MAPSLTTTLPESSAKQRGPRKSTADLVAIRNAGVPPKLECCLFAYEEHGLRRTIAQATSVFHRDGSISCELLVEQICCKFRFLTTGCLVFF